MSTGQGPTTACEESEVSRAFGEQGTAIDRLNHVADSLLQRLSPLLKQPVPEPTCDPKRQEFETEVARTISEGVNTVHRIAGSLDDALRRLGV